MIKRIAALFSLSMALAMAVPEAAAQERKSPLADAPAIRKRVEYLRGRFEFGVGGGSTIAQDFYHGVLLSGRLGFHLNDWLSIGGWGAFSASNVKTSLHDELIPTLLDTEVAGDRSPTKQQALDGMNKIGQMFAAQIEVVPFSGKFGLFSKVFASYDFYAFFGVGFINFTADTPTPVGCENQMSPGPSCPVTGLKIGPNFGVGAHAYLNHFIALGAELRDIVVKNNPSGRDKTGDRNAMTQRPIVSDLDKSWDSNYVLSLNLMFFLPAKAPISP